MQELCDKWTALLLASKREPRDAFVVGLQYVVAQLVMGMIAKGFLTTGELRGEMAKVSGFLRSVGQESAEHLAMPAELIALVADIMDAQAPGDAAAPVQ